MSRHRIETLGIFNLSALRGARSIAIVGNAGIEQQDNALINEADLVIRFNNYATRADIQYTKDRMRCDMLFTTFDLHSDGANPSSVVIGIPYPFKQVDVKRKIQKWYPNSLAYMVNPYLNADLCAEIGLNSDGYKHPLPSIGLTCLWHLKRLIDNTVNYNPSIFIAGFKWYADPEKLEIQNRKVNAPKPGHFNHYYKDEMQWVIRNLIHQDKYLFSPSCMKILRAFEPYLK